MAKWRRLKSPFVDSNSSSRRAALNSGKERASQLLSRGQEEEALAILEPLAADYQNDSDLQVMLGICHLSLGYPDAAVSHYERAYALDKDPVILFPMGLAYLQLAMYGSALHAFNESKRRGLPPSDEMQTVLEQLRQDVSAMADEMGLSMEKAIAGLRDMERGTRWLDRADYGRAIEAKRRLRALDDDERRIQTLRDALRQGKPGLGLIPRFAYYYSYELMPGKGLEEFSALVEATDDGSDPRAVKALNRFVARYPQLVVMAEKAIWEEDTIDFGLLTLRYIGTPAAHAALRRFAGSQAGSDEQRMNALLSLQASGGAQPGEAFRIWRNGAWTEIELRGFTIGSRQDRPQYKAKVAQLMEQGQAAMRAGQSAEAAALLRQAIDLEPRAYEAYNNLAAALDMTGDREASRALLEKALTINPTYVFARVNLAVKLLDQGVDAAAACLAPLEALTSFTPEEFVFYQYGLAQVAVAREDYDAARNLLDMALSIAPDYEPAKKLLALVGDIEFREGIGGIWGKLRERLADSNAQYRRRQQAKLATLAPSVADVVGIYSAEVLRPIAKAITPWQRLTGLRKAELQRLVNETLLEPATIEFLVNQKLSDTECAALAAVLDAGGAMPQQQFRQANGDDAADSPWWQFTLPESVAGRLRLHCLLVETTVAGVVYLAVPVELRGPLETALRSRLNGVRAAHVT